MQDVESVAAMAREGEKATDEQRGQTNAPTAPLAPGARPRGGLPRVAARRSALIRAVLLLLAVLSAGAGLGALRELKSGKGRLGLIAASDGRVLFVYAGGPAALAGVAPGDVLTTGGRGAASPGAAPLPLVAGFTALSIVRNGSYVLVWLRAGASSPLERFSIEVDLAVASVLWLAGMVVAFARRRRAGGISIAVASFAAAAAVCALTARDSAATWPWIVFAPAVLCALGALVLAHLTVALGHGVGGRTRGLIAGVAGLPAGVALFAGLTSTAGTFAIEVWIAATAGVLALLAIVAPILAYLRTAHEPTRRITRLVLLAAVVGLVPLYLGPALTAAAAFAGKPLTVPSLELTPWWSALGLAVMACLQGVVFTARDLRRVERAVWTGLSFALSALVLGALCSVPVLVWDPFPRALALAGAALAFPFTQRAVENLLLAGVRRPRADYGAGLRVAERAAALETTPAALAATVAATLATPLRVRGATLLLRDDEAGGYAVVAPPALNLPSDALVPAHAAATILERAVGHPAGVLISQATSSTSLSMSPSGEPWAYLFALGSLWMPLWWDGSPRGALVVGPPLCGDPFDAADLDGVGNIAAVLALAFHAFDLIGRLRERTATLGALTHRLSHAHEQERAHLSHELHDVVAQELIALTRQLRRYSDGRVAPPDIQADMLAAAQDALTATRRICNGLRPAILDLGLVPALRDLVADAREDESKTEVSLSVDGREQRLVADLEFALFRVAQEGLGNALAHAEARQVRVEVVFDAEMVVRVRDDGRGFVAPARFEDFPGDHLGLIGMRERLDEFGGVLTLTTAPRGGTILEARAPLLRE